MILFTTYTSKEAMKDPKRNLLLRKKVTRMECQVAHDEALGVPTPCSLALPTEDPVEILPEPSIRIKEHLIPVCAWVEVNGSKPEIEFFKAFCKKVDISVNKEKKTVNDRELSQSEEECTRR